jgi:hypothetical protein
MLDKKTYEVQQGPAPPQASDYVTSCGNGWAKLLASDTTEQAVQSFLEDNPILLPGAWTPGTKSGHYPLHCAAISQPLLPGLKSKRPDFMWVSTHSLMWYPTLIEIENPSKRIFNSKGVPRAEFTQARHQLAEWRTWFSRPENVQQFTHSYGIPDYMTSGRQMKLHMILVYGRRSEFENSPELSAQRASLLGGDDQELMSFDRLQPDRELAEAITIRAKGSGKYDAISVPPLFILRPGLADRLLSIDGIESAISKTPLISEERRKFLISRVPYWREWARNGPRGIINSADIE